MSDIRHAKRVCQDQAVNEGWTDATVLELLQQFIDERGLAEQLAYFLEEKALADAQIGEMG